MDRTGSTTTARGRPASVDSECPCCESESNRASGTPNTVDPNDVWIGRLLGERYRVKAKIGAGAAGSVYLARDTVLCDPVAIKIVSLEDASSSTDARSTLERVEMEVRAVSSISHPHLVRFVDFFAIGDTHAGIVTDFVDGETLRSVLEREGPLSVARVLEIVVQVATAIRAMHRHNIVHRDLKPANIVIEQLPGQGDYCQVIDFGIVRYADEAARTNAFLGTPLYASPEQVRNGSIDHRADIYSLGVTMFEMLTGRPPFDEQKAFRALMAHARAEPPTLSEVAPERELPQWLERTGRQHAREGAREARSDDGRGGAEVAKRRGCSAEPDSIHGSRRDG